MSRRGRGEGSISRRRDGRWQASYTGSDGKRYYLYGTKREDVAQKLNGTLADKSQGAYVAGAPKTLADHLPAWLEDVAVRRNLKPGTVQRYRGLIEHHILPTLGAVKLNKLTTEDLDGLYAQMRGKGLSSASIAQLHVVLHGALEVARRKRLVPHNVVTEIERPRPIERSMIVLTPAQSRRILEATRDTEIGTLYLMALQTGLRQGEMLGMRWQDINLDAGWLEVNATLSRLDGGWFRGSPKTRAGLRQIKLSPTLVTVLRQHARWQAARHRTLGHEVIPASYIFTDGFGQPLNGFHITERKFKPLLASLGLPPIRFHDLRHAFVSLMLSLGVRIDLISKMLGHSKPSITLDVYAHLIPGDQEEAVALLDRALSVSGARSVSDDDVNPVGRSGIVRESGFGSGGRIRVGRCHQSSQSILTHESRNRRSTLLPR